jgi:hypothetical protein
MTTQQALEEMSLDLKDIKQDLQNVREILEESSPAGRQ